MVVGPEILNHRQYLLRGSGTAVLGSVILWKTPTSAAPRSSAESRAAKQAGTPPHHRRTLPPSPRSSDSQTPFVALPSGALPDACAGGHRFPDIVFGPSVNSKLIRMIYGITDLAGVNNGQCWVHNFRVCEGRLTLHCCSSV